MSDTIYKAKNHNPLDFILNEGKVKRNNTMKIKNETYYFSPEYSFCLYHFLV